MITTEDARIGMPIYHDFELYFIEEIRPHGGTGELHYVIDSGYIRTSVEPENAFPVTKRIRIISDNFKTSRNALSKLGNVGLDLASINASYVSDWRDICNYADDDMYVSKRLADFRDLHLNIVNRAKDRSSETIEGVKIFK